MIARILVLLLLMGCSKPEKPNILFILVDDQHRNQMNFLPEGRDIDGRETTLSPAIDKLAAGGVIFQGLHCPSPLCVPARFNYLTGIYASRATNSWFTDLHKIHRHTFVAQETKITPETPTLAKKFKAMGYTTGFVGKNHSVEAHGWKKLDVDANVTNTASKEQLKRNDELIKEAFYKAGFDYADRIYHTNPGAMGPKAISVHNLEWITEGALKFINKNADKPFYLVYSTTVPHGPMDGWKMDPRATPAGILEKAPEIGIDRSSIPLRLKQNGIEMSKADMLWLDDNIAMLIDALRGKGILDNTIIVYVNDHGVESGKTTAYEGGMLTAGFIWGKDFAGGRINTSLTSTVDLVPTLMEMAGGKPGDHSFDGVSLLPILKGDKEQVRESVYGEMGHTRVVIKGNYKYLALRYSDYTSNMPRAERQAWLDASERYMVAIGREPFSDNDVDGSFGHSGHIPDGWDNEWQAMKKYPAYYDPDQLYDLGKDPEEQINLADKPEYKDLMEDMKAELTKYIESLPGGFGEFKEDEYLGISVDSTFAIAERLRKVVFH